jgi:hypothetical protein
MEASVRLQRLETTDIAAMSPSDAAAALRDLEVVRGRTEQLRAAVTRRIATLHEEGRAAPPIDVLGRQSHESRRSVERAERRADTLGNVPALDAALGAGRVSVDHADTVASVTARLDDEHRAALFARGSDITALAATTTPEQFRRRLGRMVDDITHDDGLDRAARQVADATALMKVDDDTGMHRLVATLAPEQGNRIRRALDHEVATLTTLDEFAGLRRDQLFAHALERLVCGTGAAAGLGPPEVSILIDHRTLADGVRHDHSVCEYSDGTTVSIETARRHACDAHIIPIVLDGSSQPLDIGRGKRLATKAQRLALRAMYRTCAIDGCDRHYDLCHIHHLHEWEHGGSTDLANLIPLCSFHHHRAHEGRWRLQLDPSTRELTVTLPEEIPHSIGHPDLLAERDCQRGAAPPEDHTAPDRPLGNAPPAPSSLRSPLMPAAAHITLPLRST